MAGPVPAIHVLNNDKNVDTRDKPGHDDLLAPPEQQAGYVMLPGMKQRTRGWPSI